MKFIGAHVSISGGIELSPIRAAEIGATAFAIFTKNQRQWDARPLEEESILAFKQNLKKVHIKPEHVLPHDGYLINLGNIDSTKRTKSLEAFIDEIGRVNKLGLTMLNFHPGSHLGETSEEECLSIIAESINEAISKTSNVTLVIENMAGQGSNLGYKFEHLATLIDKVKNKKRIGTCIDTCHTHSSGHDLSTAKSFEKVINEFDKIIGLNFLRGVHLNDSKTEMGSRKDRHESIGKGSIGLDSFKWLMSDPRFNNIPLILETPNEEIWADEIAMLKKFSR